MKTGWSIRWSRNTCAPVAICRTQRRRLRTLCKISASMRPTSSSQNIWRRAFGHAAWSAKLDSVNPNLMEQFLLLKRRVDKIRTKALLLETFVRLAQRNSQMLRCHAAVMYAVSVNRLSYKIIGVGTRCKNTVIDKHCWSVRTAKKEDVPCWTRLFTSVQNVRRIGIGKCRRVNQ